MVKILDVSTKMADTPVIVKRVSQFKMNNLVDIFACK